jgi:hypothetical protein
MPKSCPHSIYIYIYLWLCLQTAVASLVEMTACDREFRRQNHLIDDYALVLLALIYLEAEVTNLGFRATFKSG